MDCSSCGGGLHEGQGSWGYDDLGFEIVPLLVCACGESFLNGADVEEAEGKIARRLALEGRRDPHAIRFMTLHVGVRPAEFVCRFPSLTLEGVRNWRHGIGTVPNEAIVWAHQLVLHGWSNDSCRCGECDPGVTDHT